MKMEDERIKAALVALGLKEDVSMTEIRAAYLSRTTQNRFQRVIWGDEHLEKEFIKYYKSYIQLLKHHSETESADLSDYPQDQIVKFHFNQGLYYLINQDYMKAIEKFEEAYRVERKDVLVLIYMGILLIKRKNYYAAEKYLQDAVKIDDQNDDAWFYLGESYFKAGEYRKALDIFEDVRKLNPGYPNLGQKIKETKERQAVKRLAEKPPSLIQRILNKLTGK